MSLDSMTTCDSDLFRLSGQMGKPKKKMPTSIVPLCWDEQLQQTDVKVLEAKEKQSLAAKLVRNGLRMISMFLVRMLYPNFL